MTGKDALKDFILYAIKHLVFVTIAICLILGAQIFIASILLSGLAKLPF